MRKLYCLILFFVALLCSPAQAQWQRLPGPTPTDYGLAGNVLCIATNDTFVWMGTEKSGVFRIDAGSFGPWQAKNNGLETFTIYSLTYNNGLLVATTQRGIYKSTDYGNQWTAINNGLPINRVINSFAAANGVLLAATGDFGVFRSTDNGQSWQKANNGLLDNNTIDLESEDGSFWALTLNAGLFKSTDLGLSWQAVPVQGGCDECKEFEIIDSTLFLAKGNVLVSRNNGKNWDIDTNLKNITGINAYNGRLLAHSPYRLYESFDTGKVWVLDWEFNVDSSITINTALATPQEVKYTATQKHGIYRGTIAAVTWKSYNFELQISDVKQIEWYNNRLYTAAFGMLYSSSNEGMFWDQIGVFNEYDISSFITLDDKLVVGTDTGGVYVATAALLQWQTANNGLTDKRILRLLKKGNTLYALTKGGIFRSPNQGQLWVKYADNIDTLEFTDLFFDNGIVYAGTNVGIYSSDNDGASFTIVNPANIPRRIVHFIRRINGTLWLEIGPDTHLSTDGISWPRHYYIGGVTFANSLSLVNNRLYASTTAGNMFMDTATNQWNYIPTVPGLVTNVFAESDSFLFAGTGAGIWRLSKTDVATRIPVINNQEIKIYPNPATKQVRVGDGDPLTRLCLYSLTGQQLITCDDCNTFDIQALPAGIYILQTTTSKGTFAQRLVKE